MLCMKTWAVNNILKMQQLLPFILRIAQICFFIESLVSIKSFFINHTKLITCACSTRSACFSLENRGRKYSQQRQLSDYYRRVNCILLLIFIFGTHLSASKFLRNNNGSVLGLFLSFFFLSPESFN